MPLSMASVNSLRSLEAIHAHTFTAGATMGSGYFERIIAQFHLHARKPKLAGSAGFSEFAPTGFQSVLADYCGALLFSHFYSDAGGVLKNQGVSGVEVGKMALG